MHLKASRFAAALLAVTFASPALAAPPPNDTPQTAGTFDAYTAANGTPVERQAIAELFEAQPDAGVLPCLGEGSFARTVWYRLPATTMPREITVEATGRTRAVPDLAAFVQPAAGQPPVTLLPNVCAGRGVFAADASSEAVAAVRLRVPALRDVLIEVGRRGPPGTPETEEEILALAERALPSGEGPPGDRAGIGTPSIHPGERRVALGGATTTDEDPAVPACPAEAGVWRRVRPPATGTWTVTARGRAAGALAVFRGPSPTPGRLVGCVDREGAGTLVLPVQARAGKLLWIRVGADRPAIGAGTTLGFARAQPGDLPSGGSCLASLRQSVSAKLIGASRKAKARTKDRVLPVALSVAHGPLCGAQLTLVGPRGRTYATADVPVLRTGTVVDLERLRRLPRGLYRLRIEALGVGAIRVTVPATLTFRLT